MPRKYSIQVVMTALRTHHGLVSLAADSLGCSRSTLYSYVQAFPEVAAIIEESRERLVDLAEDALYRHVEEGAPWAVALVLKTLGRTRGYGDRLPTGHADHEPVSPSDDIITIDVRSNGHHSV
jgi:hypothetical protein